MSKQSLFEFARAQRQVLQSTLVRLIMAEEIARLKRNFRHRGRGLGYRGKDLYEYGTLKN